MRPACASRRRRVASTDDLGLFLLPHGSQAEELAFYVKRAHVPPPDVTVLGVPERLRAIVKAGAFVKDELRA